MTYVLGIDPSITATGICLLHDNQEPTYKTVGSKSDLPLGKRLWHLSTLLMSVIPIRTTPLVAVIETPISPIAAGKAGTGAGFNNNIMAYAMAYEFCGKFKIPYIEVSTHQLKIMATGMGNTKKEDVVKAYKERIDGAANNNNEMDAHWLAYVGWEVAGSNYQTASHPHGGWLEGITDKVYDMLEGLTIQRP